MVTAAKTTLVSDFLILCHANNRAQSDGEELQRELDDFLGLELVMCPWLPVKCNLRWGLNWRKAIPWAFKTSRWASRKFMIIYLGHIYVVALKIFTAKFFFFFSLGIKKCHLKPSGFHLYSPWISQQCCSWVHSTGSALYQGPARKHLPYWNCPRRALPVTGKWESLAKRGGKGELQVTSHSHGKPVPGDVRTGLQWLLILLALSSSLSTLVVTPNPQARTWKLSWNGSSWVKMRYPPGNLLKNECRRRGKEKWSMGRAGSSSYLCGWHVLLALDVKKTLDVVHVGLHVLKSWSHSSLLVAVV